MKYNADRHHRRSIRLRGYDYSQTGAYFVTVVTQGRNNLFGDILDAEMRLNEAGLMVRATWEGIPYHYDGIVLDAFVVMPNHIHGIIVLVGATPRGRPDRPHGGPAPGPDPGQAQGPAPTASLSLSDVVHRFKTLTTKRYADGVKQHEWPHFPGRLWQRNYYEHIIREEPSLNRIRQYIVDNPARWAVDPENPQAGAPEPDDAWRA